MIEDLHTKHPEIRSKAKMQGCDHEIDVIKQILIDYLNRLRQMP